MAKRKQKPEEPEEPGFKKLLTKCFNLRKATGKQVHDLIVCLIDVYNDKEYRLWCVKDGLDPAEYLNQFVNEIVNRTFVGLMLMYEQHPERSKWEASTIQTLYDETAAALRASEPTPEVKTRTSYKDLSETVIIERDNLKTRIGQLEAELMALRDQLQIATTANRDKDMTISNLEGRLTEIEKLIKQFKPSEAA